MALTLNSIHPLARHIQCLHFLLYPKRLEKGVWPLNPLRQSLFWWLAIIWSVLILISSIWYQHNLDRQVILTATEHAKDNWKKDAAFRRWATQHGGLYVRTNDRTPPNPGLAHLPHRDVETTTGTQLTLMNPAYMMRQMTHEFEQMYGVKGKITGKVLLNPPVNQPDDWELKILSQFEAGDLEPATEVQNINDEPFLRFMKPMLMTSEGCVTCHGHLGFKLGDVRGGVSVSIPLVGYQQAMKETKRYALLSHGIIWLLGMLGFWAYQLRKSQQDHLQRDMERKVQRSLRMGSIGQMAGGIAHDFNNILNIVVGNADLLKLKLDDEKQRKQLDRVIQAAERGAKLTHQLLDFSREETGDLTTFDTSACLEKLLDMLQAAIPGHIQISRHIPTTLIYIRANQSRFEDSVTNLILNAIDALEESHNGRIDVTLNSESPKYLLANKGRSTPLLVDNPLASNTQVNNTRVDNACSHYCHIQIEDNGAGMSEETLERLFEPFYTTKRQGRGTGLGLSQVYGFIQTHSGHIEARSILGEGTRFDLYLPITEKVHDIPDKISEVSPLGGSETILIVDDEPEVGSVIQQYLELLGYHVYIEQNGMSALRRLDDLTRIDGLITDVMMPEMNGYQLALNVRLRFPNIPVVYISGYSVKDLEKRYPNAQINSTKLQKPIGQRVLANALRERLDKKREGQATYYG